MNYFNDYDRLFNDNKKAMLYERDVDNGNVEKDEYSHPILDNDLIFRQKEKSKGTKNYLLNLVKFDIMVRASKNSSEKPLPIKFIK